MKQTHFGLLFCALLTLSVHTAYADNTWFEEPRNFSAYSLGQGKVHFKVLVFARGAVQNHWACTKDGGTYLYAEGESLNQKILCYNGDNNKNCDDDYKGWVHIEVLDGTVIITNTHDQVPLTLNSGQSGDYWLRRTGETNTPTFLEVDWYPSTAFDGKEYTAKAHVVDTRKTDATWTHTWSLGTYSAASVQAPMLYSPVFYSVGENGKAGFGHVLIPYVVYQDPVAYHTSYNSTRIESTNRTGQLFVMTTDTVQLDYNATFTVKRDGGTTQDLTSNTIKIPAFHRIYDFTAKHATRADGSTNTRYTALTWHIHTPEATDIMPSDMFQIQRAYKADFSDAETLHLMAAAFDSLHTTYTFIDSTSGAFCNTTDRTRPIYYRVNRTSTTNWGYSGHDWVKTDSIHKDPKLLTLRADSTYYHKATDFDRTRKIVVTLTTEKEGENTFWDNRAQVIVRRVALAGNDTLRSERTLSGAQFARQKDGSYRLQIEMVAEVSCAHYTYTAEVIDADSEAKCGTVTPVTLHGEDLYYTDAASIASFSVSKGYYPDYVFLQWNQTDGNADEFHIERRLAGSDNAWTAVANISDAHYYYDRTAAAGKVYEYRIVCRYSCNGVLLQDTATATGWLSSLGSIAGRISYPNGTGDEGVAVTATPSKSQTPYAQSYLTNAGGRRAVYTRESVGFMSSFTYQLWVRIAQSAADSTHTVLVCEGAGNQMMSLNLNAKTNDLIYQYGSSKVQHSLELPTDKWFALSIVFDGTTNVVSLYKDGVYLTRNLYVPSTASDFRICLLDGTNGVDLDELRIWNRILTAEEIAANTRCYLSGKEEGLAHYYPFENAMSYTADGNKQYSVPDMAYSQTSYAQRNDIVIADTAAAVANTTPPTSDLIANKAVTDASGAYCIGGVPFVGGTTFDVTPTAEHGKFSYNGTSAGFATITLDADRPNATGIDFTNTEAVRFSGRVLYRRSTIPVRGARFLVNGVVVCDATGNPTETNASGNFEFEIPKAPITVQVVMDGHTFARNGFFIVEGDSLFTPTANIDGLRMWDETKVRLVGRVAGGNDQGYLPLGFSLSKNNLGDSIQMVLELEGDNTAQIVYDPQDKTLERIDTVVAHAVGKHHTDVVYQQKRIHIYPDQETGEFFVDLFPVKYKLTQLTAQGYSTLTNGSTAMQVIDMTNRLTTDTLRRDTVEVLCNDTFRHVYHSPLTITLSQLQYGMELGYMGIEKAYLTDFDSVSHTQTMVAKNTDGTYEYLFGRPVFAEGKYAFRIRVHEDYYYNANRSQGAHDQVMLHGGKVQIYNGMHSEKETLSGELDNNGQMEAVLQADYPTYTRLGDDATRRILVSVEHNGEHVQSDPLDVYVFADRLSGTETVNITPVGIRLFDILRDPPGANSFSSLASGTTYRKSSQYHISVEAGIKLDLAFGSNYTGLVGAVAAAGGFGTFTGVGTQVSSSTPVSIPITFNGTFDWGTSYEYTTTEAISTGDDVYHVGASADIYLGATENVYHAIGHGMAVLDSAAYAAMSAQVANGTMKLVTSARNTDGEMRYLVVARKLLYAFSQGATFAYTQDHILSTVIPTLVRERNNLLQTTDSISAQREANTLKKRVYYTALTPDDAQFGVSKYHWADPQNSGDRTSTDTIAVFNRAILQWVELITMNEKEKVQAINSNQVFKTYSVNGAIPVKYSESVSYSSNSSSQYATPGNILGSIEKLSKDIISNVAGQTIMQLIHGLTAADNDDEKPAIDIEAITTGSKLSLSIKPVLDLDFNHVDSETSSTSRTYSYTLSPNSLGYMDVNVYRVKNSVNSFNKDAESADAPSTDYYYSSFMFYTLAGASRCPYEGGDSTHFYNAGTPLSNPTIPIEKPRITVDKRAISSVPADQKAVFDLVLSNDQASDIGLAAYNLPFELYVISSSNPNGLKLSIDGVPLGYTPMNIDVPHGKVVHKTLEVTRGQGYDFDDVLLRLRSTCTIEEYDEATISVHFVPAATAVTLSAPHDQWVLNTLSSRDSAGYYLPVVIEGFDIHSDGFDHIEFQYKNLNQSENDWVNLCSYYADDSLYALASGNKAMIENGKIENIRFYGERDPMEQNYDLRAVSFARYGNGFVTRSSSVLHGTKDTRCPEVFGTPTPANGLLGVEDVLSLRFSEPIAGNYLDEDANFEIVGGTNALDITQTTSLAFSGESTCVAKSQVSRNMGSHAFTIEALIRPAEQGRAMTIFSLGDTKHKLRFSLTADNRLRAEIGTGSVTSEPLEPMQAFTRCAMTYDTAGVVRFFAGTKEMTQPNQPALPHFRGSGILLFGNTQTGEEPFHGNMLEARLWRNAQEQDALALTYQKRLTGNEMELMAYYPMNDGSGTTCRDLANGATLLLQGTSWTLPEGMSLHLTAGEGVRLAQDIFARSALQDLTLMFWFKTDAQTADTAALFTTGGGVAAEEDAASKVFIGLENGNVVLRHAGQEFIARGRYADQSWHHLAYTVNRAYNIANLFVDGKQSITFAADKLGNMSGNEMWLGACHWSLTDSLGNRVQQPLYAFSGHIDHLMLYEQALPHSSIQDFKNIIPSGEEMGLVAYLPFSSRQLTDNARLELQYSPYNARIFRDANGQKIDKKQLLLLTDASKMMDKSDFAPMRESASLTRYNFAWACNVDELMLNLKMLDKEINKQNIFLTVRGVEDLNGNRMLNPVSWTVYVDCNQLRWSEKEKTITTALGDKYEFDLSISNTGGTTRQYQLVSLPSWLTAVPSSGTLSPQASQTIHFTVQEGLNVGEYVEYVYLQDDQELSERLLLTTQVESHCPWTDDHKDLSMSMSLVGQVLLTNSNDTVYDTDAEDIVAAFINDRCVGTAHITYDDATLSNHVYMTIYGNASMKNASVQMRLWQASTGKIFILNPSRELLFVHKGCYGCTPDTPVLLTTSDRKVQQLSLNEGWNWVSFYLNPSYRTDINRMLSTQAQWTAGDIVKDPSERAYAQYQSAGGSTQPAWYGTLTELDHRSIYMFMAQNSVSAEIEGEPLSKEERTLHLTPGWNTLPYLLDTNMPLTEAMADYLTHAKAGDILKSRDRFAVFSSSSKWEGNLSYMEPGQGYLLYHQGNACTFTYYNSELDKGSLPRRAAAASETLLYRNRASSNMSVIATLADYHGSTDGLVLAAYAGNELAGRVAVHTTDTLPLFFLTVGSEQGGTVRFALERNGKTLAAGTPQFGYAANAVVGTLDHPYPIQFQTTRVSVISSPYTPKTQIVVTGGEELQAVAVAVYSASGQLLTTANGQIENGVYIYEWDNHACPAGIYSAVVRIGNLTESVKLIKQY